MAAVDYYLKIGDIKGESKATGFEEQMQLASWSFGASNSGSASLGTGLGSGKMSLQDFHFVIQNGAASLPLFLHCAKGTHFPEATLTCRKTGGDGKPYPYLVIKFKDSVISSFQTGGSEGSGTLPMEQISVNFTEIEMEYKQQKQDGSVSTTNTVKYDAKKVEASGA